MPEITSPLIIDLLKVFDAYTAARGVSESRASALAFGSGTRVANIRAGARVMIDSYERALQIMSNDWPRGRKPDWPSDVPRPKRDPAAVMPGQRPKDEAVPDDKRRRRRSA